MKRTRWDSNFKLTMRVEKRSMKSYSVSVFIYVYWGGQATLVKGRSSSVMRSRREEV